jgi:hypothetical protein
LMNASDGAGTVVMGEMEMDAGSLVPKFMVGKIMEKSLAQTAEALKARIATAPPGPVFETAEAVAVPTAPGAAAAVAPAPQVVRARRKRIVHVIQSGNGYRVWLMGKTHIYKFE